MVIGLGTFSKHFARYGDNYILIGGSAMWLVLDDAGLEPRVTQDLDIVLCVEALDNEFISEFWRFIRAGRYEIQEKNQGHRILYRFRNPQNPSYPRMLELFSRRPDKLVLGEDSHLTPIPVEEEVSSLSAILMDEDYYRFIHGNSRKIQEISIVGEECLIPLKARAWLDLRERKARGERIDSKSIKKHKNDIVRLYQVLSPESRVLLPESIRNDLKRFLELAETEINDSTLRQLGITEKSETLFQNLRIIFGIQDSGETAP